MYPANFMSGRDAIELIASIVVAVLLLGAAGYVAGSVIEFKPRRRWLVDTIRAGAVLAAVRICCLWWLVFGFKTLTLRSPLQFVLMLISFYPEGCVLGSLHFQMRHSPDGAPTVLGVILYTLVLIFGTLLEIGLLVAMVAAMRARREKLKESAGG